MKRITTLAAALGLCAALPACAVMERFRDPPAAQTADLPGQIEPVHAAVIAHDQAVFRVTSNGCTTKEDIMPVVRPSNDGPIITLRRIKEDRCRESRPEGASLSWSFEELGLPSGSRLSVDNPYQMPPG
ncbi:MULTISPECIES: hypothetical protein [Alphaproteobacteria]|uniref:hypothetical protein n=1 Tax=Alphaproteobacteria TaxID=28211 RepID=UPI002737F7A5|nr:MULTISPECIES: hypothetical protein [Alphaproteobacteria]MDP3801370.1 hypothetical protein [Brevundimonas sp.]MDZ4394884.1 hypothetical protein [Cypionkella sp.]